MGFRGKGPTDCLDNPHDPSSSKFKKALADTHLKSLLNFLRTTNSSYLLHQSSYPSSPSHISALSKMRLSLDIVLVRESTSSRKLATKPYATRPTSPLSQITASPMYPPFGFSFSPTVPKKTFPPPSQKENPPSLSFTFAPENADPISFPTAPPALSPSHYDGFGFPPCGPAYKEPKAVIKNYNLWCVAKPSVPEDKLQKAMEYACGEGGANCDEIMPHGNRYFPNTLMSHASYAFNGYWQKAKNNGGTCNFGGTAMLINSDPSFINCHYVLK